MIVNVVNAFCPVAQLARSLLEFNQHPLVDKVIVVNGHYPRNYEKNQSDLKVFMESYIRLYPNTTLLDPGCDLGSAQSQNFALDHLCEELTDTDYFINGDPDAACRPIGDPKLGQTWVEAAKRVLDTDPTCVVVSCNAPMVERFVQDRHQQMEHKEVAGVKLMLPDVPTPFNLSMWRYSFIRGLGGIPQKFPHYGEVEGPVFAAARSLGFYNAYLTDYMENEDGKLMHDRLFEEWKDAHAREHTFLGSFSEFVASKE